MDSLSKVLHSASLDGGADEEVGDAQDFGWYGLMALDPRDIKYFQDVAEELGVKLSEDDIGTLETSAGAILYVSDSGARDATFYDTKKELEKAWADLNAEAEEFYSESEQENPATCQCECEPCEKDGCEGATCSCCCVKE